MRALIDEFTPARPLRIEPPFLFVAKPAAVSVPCAHEHRSTDGVLVEETLGAHHGRVEAMIESELHHALATAQRVLDRAQFVGRARPWLLDQDMPVLRDRR